nr:hypothetical protein [Actinomycetota bacterium]
MENKLGHLRRRLVGGGGLWPDEIVRGGVDSFMQMFDGLSEDDLKSEALIARVRQIGDDLARLIEQAELGAVGDTWLAEISQRLERVNPDRH